ncbi:hypothetical protein [uncultured Thiohalocapsa sp.]|uniref:hypothetical protein n=1 Tax=uncultured Thiohalocapsa sp. TaxID=768990 RepID=UPI0025DA8F35|nr:hypothetical protein [uncultured Thiohalocapsa sp.]
MTRLPSILEPLSGAPSELWAGLSPTLIATFAACDHKGAADPDGPSVQCALTDDVQLDILLNWQSPFEGAGPEARAPTMAAMLQSGALQPLAERIGGGIGGAISGLMETGRGRTGVTKLNSTQVFSGMPPLRIQCTALFRAWSDPATEVEAPLDRLVTLALPESLAPEGTLLNVYDALRAGRYDLNNLVAAAMPSKAPRTLAMTYKGRTFAPLVIESVGIPLHSPSDEHGRFVQMQVPLTIATLTAIDGSDWMGFKGAV